MTDSGVLAGACETPAAVHGRDPAATRDTLAHSEVPRAVRYFWRRTAPASSPPAPSLTPRAGQSVDLTLPTLRQRNENSADRKIP